MRGIMKGPEGRVWFPHWQGEREKEKERKRERECLLF
jgi:hypothetical protein